MASVWFSVFVLMYVSSVFGDICMKPEQSFTCDECIRCGGHWCTEVNDGIHCKFVYADNWCLDNREKNPSLPNYSVPGNKSINPIYIEKSIEEIQIIEQITIHGLPKNAEPVLVNSTQTQNIDIKIMEDWCTSTDNCTKVIGATAKRNFCTASGTTDENVFVKIGSTDEEALVKYHVPCACECSKHVEKKSPRCNKHGSYSCGVCTCDPDWSGNHCECGGRGDYSSTFCRREGDEVDCSGNGVCKACSCSCFNDREGSMYFDSDNYCIDLCTVVNKYDECFINGTRGQCNMPSQTNDLYMEEYDKSLLNDTDDFERLIWLQCNGTFDGCATTYVAKKQHNNIHVMVVEGCHASSGEFTSTTRVPLILGILGILASVMAMAGVVIWKQMNTIPPVPLKDPGYTNIEAEDCVGENPLYKPPTSSFKNPMYGDGKW